MPPATAPLRTVCNGRYALDRRLGEGGQAAVYRAHDVRFAMQRAIKVLLPQAAKKPTLRGRFEQEARTMARIDHPNVVRVYDVETGGPLPYLVMELLPGGSLADWTAVNGTMPPRLAARCVREAALGTVAAHALGIIHRDIKPQNILLGTNGVCKLTDFGIARVADGGWTQAGSGMGTQGYMAPEQSNDATTVDQRSDVFSLGMTLFVLLTSLDPTIRLIGQGLDGVPAVLHPVLERATAIRRTERQPDVATFAAELEAAERALPPDPPTPPLTLPEQPGHEIDWAVLEGLLDDAPSKPAPKPPAPKPAAPKPAAPAPIAPPPAAKAALPYQVPRREVVLRSETPAWIAEEAPAEKRDFLDETPPPVQPPPPPPPPDPYAWVRKVRLVHVAPVAALLAAIGIGLPAYQTSSLQGASDRAREARDAVEATIASNKGGMDAVIAVGGDRDLLGAAFFTLADAKTPEEHNRALLAYVPVLEAELKRVAVPGTPSSDEALAAVRLLRARVDRAQAEAARYEEQRSSLRGCLAIGVSRP